MQVSYVSIPDVAHSCEVRPHEVVTYRVEGRTAVVLLRRTIGYMLVVNRQYPNLLNPNYGGEQQSYLTLKRAMREFGAAVHQLLPGGSSTQRSNFNNLHSGGRLLYQAREWASRHKPPSKERSGS